jgi:ABC-type nickel/cobalt efflux system permease component RcnA
MKFYAQMVIEPGRKMNAILWLPIAIIMVMIALNFLPYLIAALPSNLQYLAYLFLALVIFFAIYVFYKKWRGEA